MAAVTGIIVIVLIVVLAVVGGANSATSVTIAQAMEGSYTNNDTKIQVTGNVVENSFTIDDDNVLTFSIYDPDGDASQQLRVRYAGGVSATFGNDVTAICTGKIGEDGVLNASQLVTKCPSKYENATDALSVERLLGYGESVLNKPVKVAGTVKDGTLKPAGGDERFVLVDPEAGTEMSVRFDGALSDEVAEGSSLVLTGSLDEAGAFNATDVALEG